LYLNRIATTHPINKWTVPLNPPWLNCQTILSLELFIRNCWCPPSYIFPSPGGDLHLILTADILPLNLNSFTTTHLMNKWSLPFTPQRLNRQTVLLLELFIRNCWCPPWVHFLPSRWWSAVISTDILPLHLNSIAATHPINKWTVPLNPP